jgi:hypothetical protein
MQGRVQGCDWQLQSGVHDLGPAVRRGELLLEGSCLAPYRAIHPAVAGLYVLRRSTEFQGAAALGTGVSPRACCAAQRGQPS